MANLSQLLRNKSAVTWKKKKKKKKNEAKVFSWQDHWFLPLKSLCEKRMQAVVVAVLIFSLPFTTDGEPVSTATTDAFSCRKLA